MWLDAFFVAIAGLGGFISTLASNGSSITFPALEFFGLPEHAANGVWVYRFLILTIVVSIFYLILVDSAKYLQRA